MSEDTPARDGERAALERTLLALLYLLRDPEIAAAPPAARPGVDWVRRLYHRRYVAAYERWRQLTPATTSTGPAAVPRFPAEPAAPATPVVRRAPAAPWPGVPRRHATSPAAPCAGAPGRSARAPGAPAPVPREPGPAAPRPPLRERWFQMRDFFSDHAILIVSYLGAFLLLVATLLFELYGARELNGPIRFVAVVATDVLFAAAGWACMRREGLRVVGRTYVAVFALLTPLTIAAADEFLDLTELGVTRAVAVAVAGGACAALYARLAVRLRSTAYAALSLLSVLAGWLGAESIGGLSTWTAVGATPLVAVYAAVARRGDDSREGAGRFARVADILAYAVGAGAVGATIGTTAASGAGLGSELPVALAAVAAALLAGHLLSSRAADLGLGCLAAAASAMTASQALGTGEDGAALTLGALALALVAGGERLAGRRLPPALARRPELTLGARALAALAFVTACSLPVPDAAAQLGSLGIAVLGAALLAGRSGDDRWLLAALAAITAQCAAISPTLGGPTAVGAAGHRFAFVPAALGVLTAATAVLAVGGRHTRTVLAGAAGVGATTLTAELVAGAAAPAVGWSLFGLAWAAIAAAQAWEREDAACARRADPGRPSRGTPGASPAASRRIMALRGFGALEALASAGLVVAPPAAASGLLVGVVGLGVVVAVAMRSARPLLAGPCAAAVQLAVLTPDLGTAHGEALGSAGALLPARLPALPQVAAAAVATWVAVSALAWLLRRRDLSVAVAVSAVAAALATDHAAGLGLTAAAVTLVLLGAGAVGAARWAGGVQSLQLRVVAATELIAAGGLLDDPQAGAVALLLGIVALAALLAVDTADGRWLVVGLGALVMQTIALAVHGRMAPAGAAPFLLVLPTTLAAMVVALAGVESRSRTRTAWLAPVAALATGLTATLCARGEVDAYAAVLMALALAGSALPLRRCEGPRRHVDVLTVMAEALAAAALPVHPEAARAGLLAAAVLTALRLAWRQGGPGWLGLGAAALVAQGLAAASGGDTLLGTPFAVTTLAALTASTALFAVVHERTDMVTVVKVGLTLTVLDAERVLGSGADAYAAGLVALGAAYIMTTLLPVLPRQRLAGRAGGAAHLLAAGLVATTPPELQGGLLLAGAAAVLALVLLGGEAEYGALVAVLTASAWRTLVSVPAGLDGSLALGARSYVPVPVLLLGVGAALRLAAGRGRAARWALPWDAAAAAVAAGVTVTSLAAGDRGGLGAELAVLGAAGYLAVLLSGPGRWSALLATIGGVAVPAGTCLVVSTSGAPAELLPATLAAAATALAGLGLALRYRGGSAWLDWERAHSAAALAAAIAAVAAAATLRDAATPRAAAPLVGFAATTVLAGVVALQRRLRGMPALRHVSIALLGLAPIWLALFAAARNPQAFVGFAGLALIVAGVRLARDADPGLRPAWSRATTGAGAALLLGTSGLQALGALPGAPGYVVLLLAESLTAVLAGIALGHRTLVAAGSAGALAAGIRALQQAVFVVPLYAVFGAAALALLATAWALAVLRERWAALRADAAESWQRWI